MKKILMLAVFIFGFTGIISASAAGVVIDSARVNFTDETGYPFVDSGRTLVPLRATMERTFRGTVRRQLRPFRWDRSL